MTKSPRKNVPDVGIELGAACMPSELASDRATAPGSFIERNLQSLKHLFIGSVVQFVQPSCPGAAQMFYKVLLHTNICVRYVTETVLKYQV